MSNYVFFVKNKDEFINLKESIKNEFRVDQGIIKNNYEEEEFYIFLPDGEIKVTLYKSGKLTLQYSPTLKDISYILDLFKKRFNSISHPKEEQELVDLSTLKNKYFVGLDESGAGECFGSLFVGMAAFEKKLLLDMMNKFKTFDAKNLNTEEIFALNDSSKKFALKKGLKTISSAELSSKNKIELLDDKYKSLIEEFIKDSECNKNDLCIILDDYGVGTVLGNFFEELQKDGAIILTPNKADSNYLPVMIASVLARKARNNEIQTLKDNNKLIDPDTGDIIQMTEGNPSNQSTNRWLVTYRKLYPSSRFPPFVREKWRNVKKVHEEYPLKKNIKTFVCSKCRCESLKINIEYDRNKESTILSCPNCQNQITPENFNAFWTEKKILVLDTSAIIARIVSKDLKSACYFNKFRIIFPSYIQEELDTKEPDKKRGGSNEISALSEFKLKEVIDFQTVNTDNLKDLKNDDKMGYLARKYDAAVLTKDGPQGAISTIRLDTFLFKIIKN